MDVSRRSVGPSSLRSRARMAAVVGLAAAASGVVSLVPAPVAAQTSVPPGPQTPVANPAIQDSCGTNAVLVLDASGSISSSHAVDDVRDAGEAFLDALADTGSTARVLQFGSISEQLAAQTEVTAASLQSGGVFRTAINRYYNPIPPRPSGVSIYSYRGSGGAQSGGSWNSSNSSNQYTNWDQSLDQAGVQPADPALQTELIVYVTDGDPTAYDFNQPGDPFDAGPPPDVGVNTNRSDANATTMNRAIQEANEAKASGARMLAVGVGAAVTGSVASRDRLVQIAGPQVITSTAGITSINQVDVALIEDFDALAQFLRSVVSELCSPSLSIRKLAQTSDDADYAPAPDWDITVTPSVAGGTYGWILPDTDPVDRVRCGDPPAPTPGSRTCPTNASGLANFQWEPVPPTAATSAVVSEAIEPGYTPGRPGEPDWVCTVKGIDGSQRLVVGDFATLTPPTFTLPVDAQEIITCNIFNSFDYVPGLVLTKVDAPTSLRGDLSPPSVVTSSFVVTNPPPGNTPIASVEVTDDRCGATTPVTSGGFNVGDTNQNDKVDPGPVGIGEAWQFTCTRDITSPDSTSVAGRSIVNTAVASGSDPRGVVVESPPATATITAWNPAIALTKLAASPSSVPPVPPANSITVASGSDVVYTYAVANTGNTPLGTVTATDDRCAPLVRGIDAPGDNDGTLGLGEVWTYSCTATNVVAAVTNTALVTATPLDPLNANSPFPNIVPGDPNPDRNPPVASVDTAQVEVVVPGIQLTKTADPAVVLLDAAGTPEPVTYTFVATNTSSGGTAVPLVRPGGISPTAPGWVVDARCTSAAVYVPVGGDPLANGRLEAGESATFICPGLVDRLTVNEASITGQPIDAGTGAPIGPPLTDVAFAVVDVLRPDIQITKTAVRGVVLDENSLPLPGSPDRPVRPAGYTYQVVNTGNVPLDLTVASPAVNPSDDVCAPLTGFVGDTNSDGLLDPDELWTYTCTQLLDRLADANTPPLPPGSLISGLVTNTVTVVGVPFFEGATVPDKSVTDADTAQVTVIEPGISLTKTASASIVLAGSEVTYTFVVANTGDVGLDVIGPLDEKCAPLTYVSGDGNGNGILDGANSGAAESWTYTCTRVVDLPVLPDTTDVNLAAVIGTDPLGNQFGATASATVRVFDPAISLTKEVDYSLVPPGTQVTYTFDVENIGESPLAADDVLAQITLYDVSVPAQPSCTSPTLVSGDTGGDGLLQRTTPPEIWQYECSAVIDTTTVNLAGVRGTGGLQFQPPLPVDVFDFAAAFVQVFDPAIEVIKTASPTQLPIGGGTVTYTYEVRNTGDVPLAGVTQRITDDRCSPLTYVSGDDDADGVLDTPNSIFEDAFEEVWIFTCTTTITTTTTNTVVVTGTPTDAGGTPLCGPQRLSAFRIAAPCDVSANDTAIVNVFLPGSITVVKRTDPATSDGFGFLFGFTAFTLTNGGSQTFGGLAPGTYTVTELVPDGWELTSSTCSDGSPTSAIAVGAGESVTCTFVNALASTPPLPPLPPNPPNPRPTLPSTGSAMVDRTIVAAMTTMLAGLVVLATTRRRRDDPDKPVI